MKIEQLAPENYLLRLECRQRALEEVLESKKIEAKNAPKGRLRLSSSNNSRQFYLINEAEEKLYINKKKTKLIKALAQKEYDYKLIDIIKKELLKLNSLIYELKKASVDKTYAKLHETKKKYVLPVTLSSEVYAKQWLSVQFVPKEVGENSNSYQTSKGVRVRSKSEAIIFELLLRENIPFRYEYPVQLKNYVVRPDFYCLNLRTRKEIVWEHFGMMDDTDYANEFNKKINAYVKSGYFLGESLVFTTETSKMPLDTDVLKLFIHKYLK